MQVQLSPAEQYAKDCRVPQKAFKKTYPFTIIKIYYNNETYRYDFVSL